MFPSYQTQIAKDNLKSAVAYFETNERSGDVGIGTGFHIGGGYFVTARHVVESPNGHKIRVVGRRDLSLQTSLDPSGNPIRTMTYGPFECRGPFEAFYHPDANIDVAIVHITGEIRPNYPSSNLQPALRWGNKVIEALSEGELLMAEVCVLGYPPIPNTTAPHLFFLRGEIAAVIQHRVTQKRHFVISGMARGGFSGGPVFLMSNQAVAGSQPTLNAGTVIGVIVNSETPATDSKTPTPEELGFLSAISSETIRETIAHNKLNIPHL